MLLPLFLPFSLPILSPMVLCGVCCVLYSCTAHKLQTGRICSKAPRVVHVSCKTACPSAAAERACAWWTWRCGTSHAPHSMTPHTPGKTLQHGMLSPRGTCHIKHCVMWLEDILVTSDPSACGFARPSHEQKNFHRALVFPGKLRSIWGSGRSQMPSTGLGCMTGKTYDHMEGTRDGWKHSDTQSTGTTP